jgi:hypothetical protein
MHGEQDKVLSTINVPYTTIGMPSTLTLQQPVVPVSSGTKATHKKWRAVLLVLLVVVVVAVPSSIGVLWFTSLHSTSIQCQLGQVVGQASQILTPAELVNAPYNGSAFANVSFAPTGGGPVYIFASGGLQERAQPWPGTEAQGGFLESFGTEAGHANGDPWSTGIFVQMNWTMYAVHNATVVGASKNAPCTTPYIAVPQPSVVNPIQMLGIPPLTNYTDDASESHSLFDPGQMPPPGQATVWFDNGFHAANYPTVDTCGRPGVTLSYTGNVQVPIWVTIPVGGKNLTAYGELEWNNVPYFSNGPNLTVDYQFPANAGSWDVYSPSGANQMGALAFQYHSCS